MKLQTDYSRKDLEKMAELGESNYSKHNDIADKTFLEWQCFTNPAGKAATALALDEETGALTGEISQTPMRFRCFGEDVTAACLVNSLIRRKFRNISLFYELHAQSFRQCENLAFSYGVPNPFSYPLFSRLFSCKTIAHIPLMLLPVRPKALVRCKVNPTLARLIPDLAYRGIRRRTSGAFPVSLLTEGEMGLFDDFWEEVKDKYPVMGIRRPDFMTWRYCAIPTRAYRIYAARDGGRLLGFCAVREDRLDGIKTGYIVDFLVLPGRKDVAAALLRAAVDSMLENGADLIGALMLPHCEEYRHLVRGGFLRCPARFLPQPFPLIVKEGGGIPDPRILDSGNWFFTMGDYDAV